MQVWVVCQTCQTRLAVGLDALISNEWTACPLCDESSLQVYIEDGHEEYV